MSAHALLSPSSAHRWMACPGSLAMVRACGVPDTSSWCADEGTAAHQLAARCLDGGLDATECIGDVIVVGEREFTVDAEFAGHVQTYVASMRGYALGYEMVVEQRVNLSAFVGVLGSTGTADAVVLDIEGGEIQVHDLKFGRGVKVDAEDNTQLMLYALGALHDFGLLGDFRSVLLVIHQPRLGYVSEWAISVADLLAWAETIAKPAAQRALAGLDVLRPEMLVPGESQCRWCPAKAACPALRSTVEEAIGAEFTAIEWFDAAAAVPSAAGPTGLALSMAVVGLVEQWCEAVRKETHRRLLAGVPVGGFKLVAGRKGNREWSNATDAEAALKAMRIKHDQMYDYSVISPTTAEKLVKAEVIGPRQWPKLEALIVRADGKPSVAPADDKRPAIVVTPVADDFGVLVEEELAQSVRGLERGAPA
mgnify:FL=1